MKDSIGSLVCCTEKAVVWSEQSCRHLKLSAQKTCTGKDPEQEDESGIWQRNPEMEQRRDRNVFEDLQPFVLIRWVLGAHPEREAGWNHQVNLFPWETSRTECALAEEAELSPVTRSRAVPSDGCFPKCSAPWGAEGQGWDGAERRLLLPAPGPDFSFLLEAKWCPAGWVGFSPQFCSPVCVCVAGSGLRLGEVNSGKGDRERRWELGLFSHFWRCCFWRSSGSVPGRGLLACWVCF